MFKKWFSNNEQENNGLDINSKKGLLNAMKGLVEIRKNKGEDSIIVNGDMMETEEEQVRFIKEQTKDSGIPYFDGEVEHLYQLRKLGQHTHCPRCNADLVQHYGGFAYAVLEDAPRFSTSPTGYFCTDCPTVVVDEEFIENNILGKFTFNGVFAVETESHGTQMFRTLNGKKSIYVLNEDEEVEALMEMGDPTISPSRNFNPKRKSKSRNRNKAARAARKKRRK